MDPYTISCNNVKKHRILYKECIPLYCQLCQKIVEYDSMRSHLKSNKHKKQLENWMIDNMNENNNILQIG